MKSKFLFFFTILILSFSSFAQNIPGVKQVFTYKVVGSHEIKANIFLPATEGVHPVVVYFHGGGFMFGNRDEGLNPIIKERFLENGFAVVSADYRLAPETKLDEILKDVGDVIGWLRKYGHSKFSIDKDKISVVGGSAGGYLAFSSGFDKSSAPDAIIAISPPTGFSTENIEMGDLSILNNPGPYDIVKDAPVSYGDYDSRINLWRFLAKNKLANYAVFGFDPATETEKLEHFTLTANIDSDYPPTLLVHARYDHLIALQEVEDFQKFLVEKGVENELFIVDYGHSSELINQNPEAVDKMIQFLQKQMKRPYGN